MFKHLFISFVGYEEEKGGGRRYLGERGGRGEFEREWCRLFLGEGVLDLLRGDLEFDLDLDLPLFLFCVLY